MDIQIIGTGSTGNCYKIDDGETALLIECGLPFRKIQKVLNYKLLDVAGCLCSHEHFDHCKAWKELADSAIDVYMTKGTADELSAIGHRIKQIQAQKIFSVGTFNILPFKTIHDVAEPVGFIIDSTLTRERLIFMTDTAYSPYTFKNVDYYMIEVNYIKKNLEESNLHVSLRNRIVKNHMSLETVLNFLKQTDLSKTKTIYVMHLSESNSGEKEIKEAIQGLTGKATIIC